MPAGTAGRGAPPLIVRRGDYGGFRSSISSSASSTTAATAQWWELDSSNDHSKSVFACAGLFRHSAPMPSGKTGAPNFRHSSFSGSVTHPGLSKDFAAAAFGLHLGEEAKEEQQSLPIARDKPTMVNNILLFAKFNGSIPRH